MINTTNAYLVAPFAQGAPTTATPVMITPLILPVALGQTDQVMIFRAHLGGLPNGGGLCSSFDRMVIKHPGIAGQVIASSGLGAVSLGRAVESVATYRDTGCAVVPVRVP